MRLTASKAIGEIGGAVFPRRVFAAMSASTKNLRRAWLQQSASVTGRACGRVSTGAEVSLIVGL